MAKPPKPPKPPGTSLSAIVHQERKRDALKLRKDGKEFAEIGQILGISQGSAWMLVREAIAEIPKEALDDLRAMWASRFNGMYASVVEEKKLYEAEAAEFVASKGRGGRIHSIDVLGKLHDAALTIYDRESKLYGLNAAVKVEGSGVALLGIADLLKAQEAMDTNADMCLTTDTNTDPCPTPPRH
jgi:hypothetical protein